MQCSYDTQSNANAREESETQKTEIVCSFLHYDST